MPVYPDLNLLFVHIPKTGGGAITRTLAPWRAPVPRTRLNRLRAHLPFVQRLDKVAIGTHASARWIRRKLGPREYDRYVSFSVVRNPYDRLISEYEYIRQTPAHHRHRFVGDLDFTGFLRWRVRKGLAQTAQITDARGALLVSTLIPFDTLSDGLDALFAAHDVPASAPPNRGINTSDKKPRETYLTPEAIGIINRHAAPDFDLLGFDRLSP